MGKVAFQTGFRLQWLMQNLFGEIFAFMALITNFPFAGFKKSGLLRSVRIMAADAFVALQRAMHKRFVHSDFVLLMAG